MVGEVSIDGNSGGVLIIGVLVHGCVYHHGGRKPWLNWDPKGRSID